MRCPTLYELPSPPPGMTGWPWTIETPPLPPTRQDGSAWPRISIVTPSYNQGQFIEETIRSILLQGYPDLEYVIIDGGSADNSVEIIKKYEPWLSYWVSESDRGQVHAINKGFGKCRGQYGNWINSDDSLRPHALQVVAEAAALADDADLITGVRLLRDATGGYEFAQTGWMRGWKYYLVGRPNFPQEATFFSDFVFRQVGPLDERLAYGFDVGFFAKVLHRARKIVLCDALLSQMYTYPAQKTLRNDPSKLEEIGIMKTEYFANHRIFDCLSKTKLHGLLMFLVPIVYRKERKKFVWLHWDIVNGAWRIATT